MRRRGRSNYAKTGQFAKMNQFLRSDRADDSVLPYFERLFWEKRAAFLRFRRRIPALAFLFDLHDPALFYLHFFGGMV